MIHGYNARSEDGVIIVGELPTPEFASVFQAMLDAEEQGIRLTLEPAPLTENERRTKLFDDEDEEDSSWDGWGPRR